MTKRLTIVKSFNYLLMAILLLISGNNVCASNNAEDATNFMEHFLSKTFTLVNQDVITEQLINQMEHELSSGIDYKWVGTFVMGNAYGVASPLQQYRLTELYKMHIIYSYLPLILKYKKVKYSVRTTNNVGNDTYVISVDINCKNCNGRPINIIYRVRYRNDVYYIYDMIIEGNSFLSMQRTLFKNMVGQTSSVDTIIAKMERENQRLHNAILNRH